MVTQLDAHQIGHPGSGRSVTATNPNSAGNSAQIVLSTTHGSAPTKMPVHGSSGK